MEELETNSSKSFFDKLKDFNWEEVLYKNRVPLALFLFGAIMLGLGVFFVQNKDSLRSSEIEILEADSEVQSADLKIVVEVSGAVERPGVYDFESGARIEDALILAGGISADADRQWMEKILNRAAKLTDGQKLYIPREDEQSTEESASNISGDQSGSFVLSGQGSAMVNINTATQKELESLWGIGPVYAQKIIEQRPYSSVEELIEKKIIKQNVYDRNKDLLTVY